MNVTSQNTRHLALQVWFKMPSELAAPPAPPLVLQEALQCVTELNSASLLYVFVRHGVESTLERRTVARERIGLLLYQLVKAGMLPKQQFYKG